MAHRIANSSNCSLEDFHVLTTGRTILSKQNGNTASMLTNRTIENMDKVSLSIATMSPTVNVERLSCDQSSRYLCAAGIISGLFVLIISLVAVVLWIFIFQKKKIYQGTKSQLHIPCN